jgi:hypothetical protein
MTTGGPATWCPWLATTPQKQSEECYLYPKKVVS